MNLDADCPDECPVTMETTYKYSNVVSSPYKTYQDNISIFRPRIHKEAFKADQGARAFRDDWVRCGGSIQNVGTLDETSGNLVALMVPEAIPERLFVMAYFAEYGLLQDDILDSSGPAGAVGKDNLTIWPSKDSRGDTNDHVQQRNMIARLAFQLFDADQVLGKELWNYLKDTLSEIENTDPAFDARIVTPRTVDEYLRFRVQHAHIELFTLLHRFGIGLRLTQEEQKSVSYITDRLYEALALLNDYYSWEVEYTEYRKSKDQKPLVNAVFLISKQQSISPKRAKALLKTQIRALEKKYLSLKKSYFKTSRCTPNIWKWFDVVEQTHAGTALWSCTTARYHTSAPHPLSINPFFPNDILSLSSKTTPLSLNTQMSSFTRYRIDSENCIGSQVDESCRACKAKIDEKIILEPFDFLTSLPSKGNGNSLITSLNVWYMVPDEKLKAIRESLNSVIQASLMVDDIEDQSLLRRGHPATHTIYGPGRTINTSNYLVVKALRAASTLSENASAHLLDELQEICIGQGHDLLWTYNCQVPTEAEYAVMIARKSSGAFRIVSKLMKGEATTNANLDTTSFMSRFGQYFQIRDDYCNLTSDEYAAGKGFCDDLDEGKMSIMLIHALSKSQDTQLISILQGRKLNNGMPLEMKRLVLSKLKEAGSFEYTKELLRGLYKELQASITILEAEAGTKNWVLRLLLQKLNIDGGTAGVV